MSTIVNPYGSLCKPVEGDPQWLRVAFGELGVHEAAGSGSNKRILEYFKSTSHKPTDDSIDSWCAAFVGHCLDTALGAQPGKGGSGSAAARSYLQWGVPLDQPKRGCVVVYTRPGASWTGHVAFWLAEKDGLDLVISGNQDNAVQVKAYGKGRRLGFRWVRTVTDPLKSGKSVTAGKKVK